MTRFLLSALVAFAAPLAIACSNGTTASSRIVIDGSSTVFPLSEAMAHGFLERHAGAQVTVTYSGTDTGFGRV